MIDSEIASYVKEQIDELKQHIEDRIAESLEKFKEDELADFQNEDQVGLRDISTSIGELAGTIN